MAWGGSKEQEREHLAGNMSAKDWYNKALQAIENPMEEYWKDRPATTRNQTSKLEQAANEQHAGWQAELFQYLRDMPDVTKDTDIVEWWSKHTTIYPTLVWIAHDICATPASSVPCEHLFSAGVEIATDCWSCHIL
ncbi:hypothetical protein PAXRUDRAFT_171340 [Paxillus rubicundulus Ve08.2h10]|uniref:HAT C-terminal dimerisation domain-containing protein n=1 Tax=Paxillus rubicundulus Ve08.2h10 TaxID=930991 RepID=A0A0D0D6V8_9AGAM|nr:hypothetical protein PAXRUDRAFT_171340 [Paxillus rubicundulus Ve08.2h10]